MNAQTLPAGASLRLQPLPTGTRLAYSAGAAPDAMINIALNVFLLYYLTNICGLSPALAGFAVAAGLVVDAVLDPWIGMRSDHCRSRWGRRLPFMIGAIPVLLASFGCLFALPRIDDQGVLFTVVLLLCITVRVSLSSFSLPYLAVGAELSDDAVERSRIITWRWLATTILATITVALGFGLFFNGEQGISKQENYPSFALALSAAVFCLAGLSSLAVRHTLGRQHLPPDKEAASLVELLRELRQLFRSRTFSTIFMACLLTSTGQGVTQSLSLHAYTFFWKLPGDQTQLPIICLTLGMIFGAPLAGALIKRWEHRSTVILGVLGMMLAQALPPTLRLCGLLPVEGAALSAMLSGAQFFAGMMATVAMIAFMSMTTEALDEHEHRYGVRIEALYFAGLVLAGKSANGLGALLSGVALEWIDFPAHAGNAGTVAVIPDHTSRLLGLVYGPGAAVLVAVTLLVLLRYPLSRARHRAIMLELGHRKRGSGEDDSVLAQTALSQAV